ncbi:MAG: ribonuclease HIII [Firmicutes bacterium]|nr:ribonuclease HIII [Bacillota bacterium]MCL5779581.1 ribonuclease HIII [Bacillota bacterium]
MNQVIQIPKAELQKVSKFLVNNNLEQKSISSGTSFRNKEVVVTVYNTGKVLIQGKNTDYWENLIRNYLIKTGSDMIPENNTKPASTSPQDETKVWPRIGSDESGKGDFFGPLVTAAYLIKTPQIEETLIELGVTDSKSLSNQKVLSLASKIKALGPHAIVKIGPGKYNDLYSKMNNLNKLLGWSHARAIENLLLEHLCELAVADQFGDESIIQKSLLENGKQIKLVQMHQAERDTAVAAASILARATYVLSLQQLGNMAGISLPPGAGDNVISAAVYLAKEKGTSYLKEVAKLHFQTYHKVLNLLK